MAVDAADAVELQSWLANIQASLQKTLVEVTNRLEKTKKLAGPQGDQQASTVGRTQNADCQENCPGDIARTTELSVEEVLEPAKRQQLPGQANVEVEERLLAQGLTQTSVDPTLIASTNSGDHVLTSTSKEYLFPPPNRSCLKFCMLRCFCHRRAKNPNRIPKSWPLKPVEPSIAFVYTRQENDREPLRKKLEDFMNNTGNVKVEEYEPRLLIQDVSGQQHSLKSILEAVDGCKHVVFPVDVKWKWLTPDELPRAEWTDGLWWKLVGLLDNAAFRTYAMKFHAYLHGIQYSVKYLSESLNEDEEKALAIKTNFDQQTDNHDIEMALLALRKVDLLLATDFRCDSHMLTIGEVSEAAGCSWQTFLETYMRKRNCALSDPTQPKRRELIDAALYGAHGLVLLFDQLVHRIDANDLLAFKVALLLLNGITCAAQFAWSDYIVPHVKPTPMPTWQKQIADMYATSSGG